MRISTTCAIGWGGAIVLLVAAIVNETALLFQVEMMTATNRHVETALNTTHPRGKLHSYMSSKNWKASDVNSKVEVGAYWPPACTADQLDMTFQRLPEIGTNCANKAKECPISFVTWCPSATWLDEYYSALHEQKLNKKSFLAINLGCNKGYDAVNLLRLGSNNPAVDSLTWRDALPKDIDSGGCGKGKEAQIAVSSPILSNALVYCIEPMPSTFLALQNASHSTGWGNQLKVLQLAMNNQDPSTISFPKPTQENLGRESVGIDNKLCGNPSDCDKVETKRLDLLMSEEKLSDERVNVLLIDVEGFDFEVLQGGSSTLRNTEYVEFEFHSVGQWRSEFERGKKPLKLAIDYLDEIGFTCYWAGRGELWRITQCWQRHYGGVFWSNVACAHRRLAPSLLEKMETVFLDTVSTSVFPDPPIDIANFQLHEKFRYDMILLRDSDGNERYQLVVVDRPFHGSTNIKEHTCVWLDPPGESKIKSREDLNAAAERMGCIRMIAVDRRPPGVSDDIVEKELHHVVRVLAQDGFFLGLARHWTMQFKEVHFVSNQTSSR